MAEPGRVDPEVAREAVARTFRTRDEAELQSDLVALIERRTDLAAAQSAELFKAAIGRLQEHHGVTHLVPSAAAIGAWVDAVVPPDRGSVTGPVAGAVPYAPDPNAIALLTGPASEVARGLLALAGGRPDLSDLQRHELFLAGLVHLVIRKAGFIVQPTRRVVFEWIDLVAPARISPADAPAHRQPDSQDGTPSVPGDPAGNPSFGENASDLEMLASTVGGPSNVSGEGLTSKAGVAGVSPPPVTTGWHALTPEEATRHYVERGLSDDTIRQRLAPWLNHMTNAEYRESQALLNALRAPAHNPPDFRDSPDARLLAQAIAFQARHNTARMRRARLVAPADLREALGHEPTPEEVEAWAETLYHRNDTAIELAGSDDGLQASGDSVRLTPRQGPGRPGWTPQLFEDHWRTAVAGTNEPSTFKALAANFVALDGTVGGVSGDHLRRLRRRRFPQ